jgi:4'-phosphopantetheinyl transferase
MPKTGAVVVWAHPILTLGMPGVLLEPEERDRAARLSDAGEAARFVTGRHLTRALIARLTGRDPLTLPIDRTCPTCGKAHGRPSLADDPGLSLSVSHAGMRVAVAATRDGMLGVDVESTDSRLVASGVEDLIPITCTADEQAVLAALPEGERGENFLSYWIRKEAVLKATGDGLRVDPRLLHVSGPAAAPALLAWSGRADFVSRTTMHRLEPGARHIGVLCTLDAASATVAEFDASDLLP